MPRSEASSPTKLPSMGPQVLRQQQAAIAALAADNRRMKEELAEERRYAADPSTPAAKKLIQNLEAQDRAYEELISEQQAAMEAALAREAELREAAAAARAAAGGVNSAAEASVRAQRRVVLLENRVQQAAAARSAAELAAGRLKDRVDGLRREKRLFEELTVKMEAGVAEKAREVAEVLAKTTEAHEARGRAQAMRAQVLAQAAKDAAAAEAEWAQMGGVLAADRARREAAAAERAAERSRRMEELMQRTRAVGAGRPGRGAAAKPASQRPGAADLSEAPIFPETPAPPPAERLRAVQAKLAAAVAAVPGAASPEDALAAINDLKDLCFRLFASLTEAHARLEGLEDSAAALRAAAAAAGEAPSSGSAHPASGGPPTAGDPSDSEKALEEAERRLQAVCTEVGALCSRLTGACPEIEAALAKEGPPRPSTLMLYIGLVEQWAGAALRRHGAPGAAGDGAGGWPPPHLKDGEETAPTALVDPPSVVSSRSHRGSVSGRSGRSGGSAGPRAGGAARPRPRPSVAATSESSEPARVLELEVLAQRARRAVEQRLADAATETITAGAEKMSP